MVLFPFYVAECTAPYRAGCNGYEWCSTTLSTREKVLPLSASQRLSPQNKIGGGYGVSGPAGGKLDWVRH